MTVSLLRPVAAVARTVRRTTGYGLPKIRPVFVHIPKTGGRSIGRMLKAAYWGQPTLWLPAGGEEYERLLKTPPRLLDRYAVYRGHVPPGFAERVSNPFVFTFLREPMDRLMSMYYFQRSRGDKTTSLSAFLESESADNTLTRFLVREPSADAAIDVLSKMHFIGLMEAFDRDTRRLFEMLGKPPVAPIKWKPNHARVELEDLSSKVRAALERRTIEDRKVYKWALGRR